MSKAFTVRVTHEQHVALTRLAKQNKKSLAGVVGEFIEDGLSNIQVVSKISQVIEELRQQQNEAIAANEAVLADFVQVITDVVVPGSSNASDDAFDYSKYQPTGREIFHRYDEKDYGLDTVYVDNPNSPFCFQIDPRTNKSSLGEKTLGIDRSKIVRVVRAMKDGTRKILEGEALKNYLAVHKPPYISTGSQQPKEEKLEFGTKLKDVLKTSDRHE